MGPARADRLLPVAGVDYPAEHPRCRGAFSRDRLISIVRRPSRLDRLPVQPRVRRAMDGAPEPSVLAAKYGLLRPLLRRLRRWAGHDRRPHDGADRLHGRRDRAIFSDRQSGRYDAIFGPVENRVLVGLDYTGRRPTAARLRRGSSARHIRSGLLDDILRRTFTRTASRRSDRSVSTPRTRPGSQTDCSSRSAGARPGSTMNSRTGLTARTRAEEDRRSPAMSASATCSTAASRPMRAILNRSPSISARPGPARC